MSSPVLLVFCEDNLWLPVETNERTALLNAEARVYAERVARTETFRNTRPQRTTGTLRKTRKRRRVTISLFYAVKYCHLDPHETPGVWVIPDAGDV